MSGGGQSSNTTVSQSGPPQAFIDAFNNVNSQAQQVASTPYSPYPGNTVAPLAPDQLSAMTGVENAQGIAAPYINTAAQYINQSTTPLWGSTQQWSPQAVQQYESPYTQDVVNATQAEFNNQNQQQNQGIIGNAISKGAWGGDRAGVAQGIAAGQEQLAQAPVIAGLNNQGYSQALQEFNQQQGAQLGANQANAWLNSQAGAGMANLGNEAQNTTYAGINALQGVGNIEQQQAQAGLNAPYQQYLAQQAYPFQTTGWLANIAEGLGGASGGTASTTTPGPSVGSQIAGAGLAGAGILGQTGAFGSNGYLTNLFGSGAAATGGAGTTTAVSDAAGNAIGDAISIARGGAVQQRRAPGGGIVGDTPPFGNTSPVSSAMPSGSSVPFGVSTPDVDVSIVPGSAGDQMGNAASHPSPHLMNTSTGSTTTTTTKGGDSTFGSLLKLAGGIAAGVYGGPAGALAANALSSQVHFNHGGIVPFPAHRARASGGIIAANDTEPFRRVAGGSLPVSVSMVPSSGSLSQVPSLAIGPPSGNSGGAVQDYLNTVAAGAFHGAPPGPPPPPVAAPQTPPPVAPVTPPPPPQMPQHDGSEGGGASDNDGTEGPGGDQGGGDTGDGAGGGAGNGGDGAESGEGEGPFAWGGGVRRVRRDGGGGIAISLPQDDDTPSDDRPALGGIAQSYAFAPPPPATLGGRAPDMPNVGGVVESIPSGGIAGSAGPVDRHDDGAAEPDATIAPNWTPESAAAAPHAPPAGKGDKSDLWRTLMYTGLGIMGGTSPHAAVNIGRGALAGLSAEESAKLRETQQEYNQTYRDQVLGVRSRGQDLRAGSAQAAVDARLQIAAQHGQRIGLSGAQFQQNMVDALTHPTDGSEPMPLAQAIEASKGYLNRSANAGARTGIMQQNADTNARRATTQETQGQARISQGADRIAIAKGNLVMRQADIDQRAQARADAGEDMAAKAIMGNAALAGKPVPSYNDALGIVRGGRAKQGPAPVPGGGSSSDPLGLNAP